MSRLSRQGFLRGAVAVAGGALLGGCRSSTPTPPAAPPSAPSTAPRDWQFLADEIGGRVILPGDGEFDTTKALFNSRFDGAKPAAVVTTTSTADVQHAVTFAAKNGIKVAARAGGHSYIGDSAAADTMVIDLRHLRGDAMYDSSSQQATISTAADLNSVQRTLDAYGRSIPTGSCPTVGVAGLTLGGGLGADARGWGLTCDALVSATVVLPSGEVVVASADEHDDLYWGLRGGGGGHFGIVTSFTFRTFPTVDRDVVTLTFPESAAAQAISGWKQWIDAADHANWGMVNLTASDGGLRCSIVVATPAGDGQDAARELTSAVGTPPVDKTLRTLNHMDFVDYFSGGEDATSPRAVVAGSDIVDEMSSAAAESIVAAMSARSPELGSASVVAESLSGAVRDIDPGATAFPWRRQAACLQWYTEPAPEHVGAANDWLTNAHHAVGDHSVGGYVNYVESGVAAERYFGDNLARLAKVRQKYDPDSLMYSSVRY